MLPKRFVVAVWVAITLGGSLISVVSEIMDDRHAIRLDPLVKSALSVLVQRTAAALADGAPAQQWLPGRVAEDAFDEPFRIVVLDGQDRVVGAAGASTADAAALARLGARSRRSGHLETESAGQLLLAALAAETPDGEHYVVAAASPDATHFVGTPFEELVVRHLAIMVLTTFACLALSRYSKQPVVTVRHVSRRLANGDLSIRVPAAFSTRSDELGDMVREFNAMADRIQAIIDAQTQMLHDVSHEVRSPLARLQIAVDLARRHTQEFSPLDRIEIEVGRIDTLVADLLTYGSVLGAFDRTLDGPVRIADLMREVTADARYEAACRRVTVLSLRNDECLVIGCDDLLRSAFENVLRNAVKYTDEGTTVAVSLQRNAARVVAAIRDHGPGVPPGELERIFDPFHRLDNARRRNTGGAGLGLAIARRIVTTHHGVVRAFNHPDSGLCVEIDLPLAPD